MSKLIWGFASLIAAILAIIFGGIAIFFSVTSIVTLKKYLFIFLEKLNLQGNSGGVWDSDV